MAQHSKFGQMPGATPGGGGLRCEEWEALLVDALDGILPRADAAAFDAHSASCANCADILEHAKQGQEWLGFLHAEPEVPSGLVGKILDKTLGAGAVPLPVVAAAQVAGAPVMAMPLRRSFHETRLMMTVAMAFFSIALTLNLAGVKLTSLHIADLRPSAIGSALSRQFYGARGQVVHYYENLRFVYQLESRVRELRRDTETAPSTPQPRQQKNTEPSKQGGASKDGSFNADPERGAVLTASEKQNNKLAPSSTKKNPEVTEVRVSETTGFPIFPNQAQHQLQDQAQYQAGPRLIFTIASHYGRSLA